MAIYVLHGTLGRDLSGISTVGHTTQYDKAVTYNVTLTKVITASLRD